MGYRKTEWLWLAGLLLLVSLQFWFPPTGGGLRHDSYSTSAEGKKALFLLLRRQGYDVQRNRRPIETLVESLDFDDTLCLLGPSRYPTGKEWELLLDWVVDGGTLLFAAGSGDEGRQVEVEIPHLDARIESSGWKQTTDVTTTLAGGELIWRSRGEIATGDSAPGLALVKCDRSLQAVGLRYGGGYVVLLASDFVFSNQSLAWEDQANAELAFRLVESAAPSERIYVDERLNASGTPKMVGLLLEPFLRPVTLQLMAGLLIFGWWRSRRFGPLLPQSTSARHNIVDHTDTLGMLYFKSGGGTLPLRAFLRQVERELRMTSLGGKEERVLAPVAARMHKETETLQKLFASARRAARGRNLDRRTAARMIRRLALVRRAAIEPPPARENGD